MPLNLQLIQHLKSQHEHKPQAQSNNVLNQLLQQKIAINLSKCGSDNSDNANNNDINNILLNNSTKNNAFKVENKNISFNNLLNNQSLSNEFLEKQQSFQKLLNISNNKLNNVLTILPHTSNFQVNSNLGISLPSDLAMTMSPECPISKHTTSDEQRLIDQSNNKLNNVFINFINSEMNNQIITNFDENQVQNYSLHSNKAVSKSDINVLDIRKEKNISIRSDNRSYQPSKLELDYLSDLSHSNKNYLSSVEDAVDHVTIGKSLSCLLNDNDDKKDFNENYDNPGKLVLAEMKCPDYHALYQYENLQGILYHLCYYMYYVGSIRNHSFNQGLYFP